MKLKVVVHSAEEGGYWAEVPALPGCLSQGDSMDEIMTNIREAVEGWLTARSEQHEASSDDRLVEIEV